MKDNKETILEYRQRIYQTMNKENENLGFYVLLGSLLEKAPEGTSQQDLFEKTWQLYKNAEIFIQMRKPIPKQTKY